MIPNQTLVTFPEFADSGTKTQPGSAKYSAGFQEADVLPAEWLNYFLNKSSDGISTLNDGVESVEAELNNVVMNAGITPSAGTNNQVLSAIQYMLNQTKAEAILAAHPVGSLYWSSESTNPNSLFGGTWTQIKDKFVLAAGDIYTAGQTGGSSTVTLQTTNLPAHSHGMNHHHYTSGTTEDMSGDNYAHFQGTDWTSQFSISSASGRASGDTAGTVRGSTDDSHGTYNRGVKINLSHTHEYGAWSGDSCTTDDSSTAKINTDSTGDGTALTVMPPYTVKYCWQRTA